MKITPKPNRFLTVVILVVLSAITAENSNAQTLSTWPPKIEVPENMGAAPPEAFYPRKVTPVGAQPEVYRYGRPGANEILLAIDSQNQIIWQKTIGSKGNIKTESSSNGQIISLLTSYAYPDAQLRSPEVSIQNFLFLLQSTTGRILFSGNAATLLKIPPEDSQTYLPIQINFRSKQIKISCKIKEKVYEKVIVGEENE